MNERPYPPTECTLRFAAEAGRFEVVVARQADGTVRRMSSDGPAARLFEVLDLITTDRLVAATRSVIHDGASPWRDRVAGVLVSVAPDEAVLSLGRGVATRARKARLRRDPGPVRVTSVSLALALEHHREFLASWTDGQYHDVTLHEDGVAQTHRMVRAADGTVQIVQPEWWTPGSLFLSDLQDEDDVDFFLERFREVADGTQHECRTGTNATNLVIRRDSCELSHLHGEPVVLDSLELRSELVGLRAFAADRS